MKKTDVKFGTCDCHKYALADATFRRVYWCGLCKAWLCSECQDKWFRRFVAMCVKFFVKMGDKL